jgi:hypothetical protein
MWGSSFVSFKPCIPYTVLILTVQPHKRKRKRFFAGWWWLEDRHKILHGWLSSFLKDVSKRYMQYWRFVIIIIVIVIRSLLKTKAKHHKIQS